MSITHDSRWEIRFIDEIRRKESEILAFDLIYDKQHEGWIAKLKIPSEKGIMEVSLHILDHDLISLEELESTGFSCSNTFHKNYTPVKVS